MSDKLLSNVEAHPNWPLYDDVFNHPTPRLKSRRPIWSDMIPVDISQQWREDWLSAFVVNHAVVADPTIRQPGFDLPRRSWSMLNRFRSGQGLCRANRYRWGLDTSFRQLCMRSTADHVSYCQLVPTHKA